MVRTKVVTVMRWYAQDTVNQEESEQNEVDGMKKGADSTEKVMHMWKSGWWFVMRKIQMVEIGWLRMTFCFSGTVKAFQFVPPPTTDMCQDVLTVCRAFLTYLPNATTILITCTNPGINSINSHSPSINPSHPFPHIFNQTTKINQILKLYNY